MAKMLLLVDAARDRPTLVHAIAELQRAGADWWCRRCRYWLREDGRAGPDLVDGQGPGHK